MGRAILIDVLCKPSHDGGVEPRECDWLKDGALWRAEEDLRHCAMHCPRGEIGWATYPFDLGFTEIK